MAGSHVLSQYYIFASTIIYLCNVRVISFFQTPQGTITAPEQEATEAPFVIVLKLKVNC